MAEEITPEKLAEELRKLKIEDLVLSTVTTLGQLTYGKLESKDFEQARLAIDALRALVPVLDGSVAGDVHRDFEQMVANLQLAYAKAAAG